MKQTSAPILTLILLVAAVSSGCRSMSGPGSASFASVEIHGKPIAEIREATVAVFQADGYTGRVSASGGMVFDKEGTRANQLAYGGLIATHEGQPVLVRVKVDAVDLGGGSCRLQGHAFMVRSPGDSFFEDEVPLPNRRSRPYQNLLDDVAKRLKKP